MKFATLINIEDAIAELIANQSLFTAYDVTKTLRHAGYHVKHAEVRNAVRDYDFPYEYREGVDSSIGAIVHYHMNDDIEDYDLTAIPEFLVSFGGGGPTAPSSSGPNGNGSGGNGGATAPTSPSIVDKRSRYCVSATNLRNAGFVKGMRVKILVDHDKIVIHTGTDGAEVTVDKSNNVRIAKGTLQNAFDSIPASLKVEVSNGRIELSIDD